MQAVIICGGLGSRMAPLTDNLPKSLIPVLGEPFARRQLRWLSNQGITNVVFCTGHLGHMIRDEIGDVYAGMEIRYSQEHEPLGKLDAIKNALPLLDQWFFQVWGDSYLPELDLYKMALEFLLNRPRTLTAEFNGIDYGVTCYDRTTFEHDAYPVYQKFHECGSFDGLEELERLLLTAC